MESFITHLRVYFNWIASRINESSRKFKLTEVEIVTKKRALYFRLKYSEFPWIATLFFGFNFQLNQLYKIGQ